MLGVAGVVGEALAGHVPQQGARAVARDDLGQGGARQQTWGQVGECGGDAGGWEGLQGTGGGAGMHVPKKK